MTRNWPLMARPLPLLRHGNGAAGRAPSDANQFHSSIKRGITMNTASKLTLAALALTVLATAAAQAQVNNANITATATVQQPINVAAATPFPVAGASTSLSGTGALFVWVGGQVNPASNQPAGVYTASVTLTVTY